MAWEWYKLSSTGLSSLAVSQFPTLEVQSKLFTEESKVPMVGQGSLGKQARRTPCANTLPRLHQKIIFILKKC